MQSKLSIANLEFGRPTVDAAIRQMSFEIRHARMAGCTAVKLIHGYGSSGTGGKIRTAVRRKLAEMQQNRQISAVIMGEDFSIFDEGTRRGFLRCDALRRDSDLERRNQGITLVIL